MTTAAAEKFGPYIIYQRLGVGGMATVHRALEQGIEGFERIVALKRLLSHLAEDDSFVKSFVREAKLASLLNHVNIVQIYELGRVGSEYFISMEYVEGRDVRRILRNANKVTGPTPIQVTVGLLLQLCDALDYAHTKTDDHGRPLGIVHRDVSPSNLIVTQSGYLKVIDFGIAKAHPVHLQSETGRIKGKLAYMSPEAISGLTLDARSDVFSTGVIAHELITARPLFATKNEYQTMQNVERGDIKPPSAFNQACPPELDAIVLKALARDPADRFFSAAALRDALTTLRDRYKLATDHRTIREWLDWAFSAERAQATAARTSDPGIPSRKTPPPPPSSRAGTELAEVRRASSPGIDTADRAQPYEQMAIAATTWDNVPTPRPSGLAPLPTARAGHEPPRTAPRGSESPVRDSSTEFAIGSDDPIAQLAQVWKAALRPAQPPVAAPSPGDQLTEIAGLWRSAIRGTSSIPNQATFVAEDPTIADPPIDPTLAAEDAAVITAPSNELPAKRSAVWIAVAALSAVAIAAGATILTLSLTTADAPTAQPSMRPQPSSPAASRLATVKFVVEPADAEITVEGQPMHRGAPWTTQLAAGVHEVQIKHPGHRTWLTALELSASETQRIHVVLAPLTTVAAPAGATLVVKSTPSGLDVILDDKPLGLQTPVELPLTAGVHSIRLELEGSEVWSYELSAESSALYEFNPVIAGVTAMERQQREARPARRVGPAVSPTPNIESPAPAAIVSTKLMKKLSGPDPVFTRKGRVPAVVATLVCTDIAGVVTSATIRTADIEPLVASEIRGTLLGWRYAPYRNNGVATPACFIVIVRP
ncbi:MAG: protein kinase [Kofleriaceae bacterium]